MDINKTPIELSESELNNISGGIDILLSGSMFEQSEISSVQQTPSTSNFKSNYISSSAFQIGIFGTGSVNDAKSFFTGLVKLFGRR